MSVRQEAYTLECRILSRPPRIVSVKMHGRGTHADNNYWRDTYCRRCVFVGWDTYQDTTVKIRVFGRLAHDSKIRSQKRMNHLQTVHTNIVQKKTVAMISWDYYIIPYGGATRRNLWIFALWGTFTSTCCCVVPHAWWVRAQYWANGWSQDLMTHPSVIPVTQDLSQVTAFKWCSS